MQNLQTQLRVLPKSLTTILNNKNKRGYSGMKKKSVLKKVTALTMALCLMVPTTAWAGQWTTHPEYDNLWVYKNDDGTYAKDCWETIDGKYYHFNILGVLDTDCITEDGYHVDENGAWIESIPQMSQEEMDNYYRQVMIDGYIAEYQLGWDLNQLTADAKEYFGEEQGQEIMDYIQSNYEYGSVY